MKKFIIPILIILSILFVSCGGGNVSINVPRLVLNFPANAETGIETNCVLTWNATPTEIAAVFSRESNLKEYRVYFAENKAGYSYSLNPATTTAKSYQLPQLKEAASYKWQIEMVYQNGQYVKSEERYFVTRGIGVLEENSTFIDENGGTLESDLYQDSACIEIPQGTFSDQTEVSYKVVTKETVGESEVAAFYSNPVEFSVSGNAVSGENIKVKFKGFYPSVKRDDETEYEEVPVLIIRDGENYHFIDSYESVSGGIEFDFDDEAMGMIQRNGSEKRGFDISIGLGIFRKLIDKLIPPKIEIYKYSNGRWNEYNGNLSGSKIVLFVHGIWSGHDTYTESDTLFKLNDLLVAPKISEESFTHWNL